MKLAIDTNLLISATFKQSTPPALVLAAWRMKRFEWVSCDQQMTELTEALRRPQIIERMMGGSDLAERLLLKLQQECTLQVLNTPLPRVCRDIKGDFLFALHDQHGVDLIISGDKDVLALKDRYPVLTARELIDRL